MATYSKPSYSIDEHISRLEGRQSENLWKRISLFLSYWIISFWSGVSSNLLTSTSGTDLSGRRSCLAMFVAIGKAVKEAWPRGGQLSLGEVVIERISSSFANLLYFAMLWNYYIFILHILSNFLSFSRFWKVFLTQILTRCSLSWQCRGSS